MWYSVCVFNFGHGLRGYLVNEHDGGEIEEAADIHYGVGLRGGAAGLNIGDNYQSLIGKNRMSRRLSLN
jgi:hypothetical protein